MRGRCLENVWNVTELSGMCLLGVCKVFKRCLQVSGRHLEVIWKVSGGCLEGVLKVSRKYWEFHFEMLQSCKLDH